MRVKVNALLPCMTFFAGGRFFTGVLTFLMQSSIILWPVSYRMARLYSEERALDRMLDHLSAAYELPAQALPALPFKRFRPAEGASKRKQTA